MLLYSLGIPSANAMSCVDRSEKLYSKCSDYHCGKVVYVKEVPGHLPCMVRPVVDVAPLWAKDAIEYELKRAQYPKNWIYQLEISTYWQESNELENMEDYIRLSTDKETSSDFRYVLSAHESNDISRLIEEWEERETRERYIYLSWKAGDWLSFVTCLYLIVLSVRWFQSWLMSKSNGKFLTISFAVQASIFCIATLGMFSMLGFLVSFLFFVLPLVWLYEVIFFVCFHFFSKRRFTN